MDGYPRYWKVEPIVLRAISDIFRRKNYSEDAMQLKDIYKNPLYTSITVKARAKLIGEFFF